MNKFHATIILNIINFVYLLFFYFVKLILIILHNIKNKEKSVTKEDSDRLDVKKILLVTFSLGFIYWWRSSLFGNFVECNLRVCSVYVEKNAQ